MMPVLGPDVIVGLTTVQLRALVAESTQLSPQDQEALSEMRLIKDRLRWIIGLLILGIVFAGGNLAAIWQLPHRVTLLEERMTALEKRLSTQPTTPR